MDRHNVGIAEKVPVVKRQDMPYVVDSHRRDEPRIVDLDAGHSVCDEDLAPLLMNREAIG